MNSIGSFCIKAIAAFLAITAGLMFLLWFFMETEAHPVRMGLCSFGLTAVPNILNPLIAVISGIQENRIARWIYEVVEKWIAIPIYREAQFLLL
jgi:hypothetical protein